MVTKREPTASPAQVTEQMVQDYVRKGGVRCLFCGSHDIEGGSYDYESPELGQKVRCLACGRSWIDVYVLSRVELIDGEPAESEKEKMT